MRLLGILLLSLGIIGHSTAGDGPAEPENETKPTNQYEEMKHPRVILQTNHGDILIELYPDKAPVTVENFLRYTDDGFYDGTIFHRVISGFMIQGGGFDADMKKRATRSPIRNEADNGLQNERGTIAMARLPAPDTATSQFFINHRNNAMLNHRNRTPQGFGYCVFGRVVDGMDVVDRIAQVRTTTHGGHENVPVEPVVIEHIKKMVD